MKQELTTLTRKVYLLTEESHEIDKNIASINDKISELENTIFDNYREKASLEEDINIKNRNILELEKQIEEEKDILSNLESISNNSVNEKEKELINSYNNKLSLKEKAELRLKKLDKEISDLKDIIIRKEADNKEKINKIKSLEKESNSLEIDINKLDIKVENMLEILTNDY